MNSRMNMLHFTLDDSDEDSPRPQQPATTLPPERLNLKDRFQSVSVTRGVFSQEDEDGQYLGVLVRPMQVEPPKQEEKGLKITMVKEVQHDQEELPLRRLEFKATDPYMQGKVEVQSRNEDKPESSPSHEEQFISKPIFTPRNFEIALSDSSSDSKTEGKDEQPPQQEELQPSNAQNQSQNPSNNAIEKLQLSNLMKNYSSVKTFLHALAVNPIPVGKFLHLIIFRKSSGLSTFWPQFQLVMDDGSKELIYAKKMMGSTTSNYYITTEPGIESVTHPSFIGKLRGNFSGSVYHVFDNGVNPEKANQFSKARRIQATIRFKSQIMTMQPRCFDVFTLREGAFYEELKGVVPMKEYGLDELYQIHENKDKIWHYSNRRPVYSQAFKGYILNFSGRVQKPSIKNFILEDVEGDKREILMLGKTADDLFRMDVSSPLAPHIALCICLANFDSKFLSD